MGCLLLDLYSDLVGQGGSVNRGIMLSRVLSFLQNLTWSLHFCLQSPFVQIPHGEVLCNNNLLLHVGTDPRRVKLHCRVAWSESF